MRVKLAISIALILLPVLLVFKNFFGPGSLAWGDAPHFYSEGLKELVSEPQGWVGRGVSFGGVNKFIFIWPIMFLYGVLGNFLGNDFSIRILFYFPSLVLSIVGPVLLSRYLKLSKIVWFFSSIIYCLNTYYLLLIDGGQVGVALAYGLFPLTLLHLKKLVDGPTLKTFYLALIFLFILSIMDPRLAVISVVAIVIWSVVELKVQNLIYLIPLGIASFGLNMYWIFPLIKNVNLEPTIAGPSNLRWYDPLFLFSPHWPENLFGLINKPPVYFLGIPILIAIGAFKQKKIGILFLVFSLLTLGLIPFYKLPFGVAFRDSTKFFIPLILFAGILIGETVDRLQPKSKIYRIFIYAYVIFLIYPAFLGKMNFVLGNRTINRDFQKIYQNLKSDSDFYRTVWFPEVYPLSYETIDHPTIDARDLAGFVPFATINASEDVFNFLNNENFVDKLRTLGIKYLFLSDNPREISKNDKDQKDWNTITSLITENKNLEKVNWSTQIPVYKINDSYPRFYAVKQLVGVVGAFPATSHKLPATVFFEDGKWDPHLLEGKDPKSVVLVFNGGDKLDLAMSFLQRYFVTAKDVVRNEWAVYTTNQYLKYKYQLLIRGVKFTDFDYSKGISFSTKKGEKIELKFTVPKNGDYVFVKRTMAPSNNETNLKWTIVPLNLSKGEHKETIENNTDLEIFNVAALIPKKDFDDAQKLADTFTKHFTVVNVDKLDTRNYFVPVQVETWGTLKYKFEMPKGDFWVIFSDNYNPLWKERQGDEYHDSVPVYSMVNGFYAEDKWTKLGIEFKGQDNVRWGLYWSVISVLILAIIYLWKSSNNENSKNN